MGMFDEIGKASATFNANYERPGKYIEWIKAVKTVVTRQNGDGIVLEKRVAVVLDDNSGQGHKPGEEVSHMLLSKYDSFLGNVKAMVIGIMGLDDPDSISDAEWVETCEEMVDEKKAPLAGLFVEVHNRNIVTRNENDFTVVSYIQEVHPEEVRELMGDYANKFLPADDWDKMIAEAAD